MNESAIKVWICENFRPSGDTHTFLECKLAYCEWHEYLILLYKLTSRVYLIGIRDLFLLGVFWNTNWLKDILSEQSYSNFLDLMHTIRHYIDFKIL